MFFLANCCENTRVLPNVTEEDNFVNEIIWKKLATPKAQTIGFGNIHDSIYYYKNAEKTARIKPNLTLSVKNKYQFLQTVFIVEEGQSKSLTIEFIEQAVKG